MKNQSLDGNIGLIKIDNNVKNPYDEDFKRIDFDSKKINQNVLKVTIGTKERYIMFYVIP